MQGPASCSSLIEEMKARVTKVAQLKEEKRAERKALRIMSGRQTVLF
jgi:hypothetical protein